MVMVESSPRHLLFFLALAWLKTSIMRLCLVMAWEGMGKGKNHMEHLKGREERCQIILYHITSYHIISTLLYPHIQFLYHHIQYHRIKCSSMLPSLLFSAVPYSIRRIILQSNLQTLINHHNAHIIRTHQHTYIHTKVHACDRMSYLPDRQIPTACQHHTYHTPSSNFQACTY